MEPQLNCLQFSTLRFDLFARYYMVAVLARLCYARFSNTRLFSPFKFSRELPMFLTLKCGYAEGSRHCFGYPFLLQSSPFMLQSLLDFHPSSGDSRVFVTEQIHRQCLDSGSHEKHKKLVGEREGVASGVVFAPLVSWLYHSLASTYTLHGFIEEARRCICFS